MRLDISQWRDRTELPVIIWASIGIWERAPVAVDDSHEADLYDELTRAAYAVHSYMTWDDLVERADWYDLTPAQMEELYERGDYSAERAGLPSEYYAEGVNEDGSDAIIYIGEEFFADTRRAPWPEAVEHLNPEDVDEVWRELTAARREYYA